MASNKPKPPGYHAARHRGCGGLWEPMPDNARKRQCGRCGFGCKCGRCTSARPALFAVPNRCVVLGVDAAARAGWSVWYPGADGGAVMLSSGEVESRRLSQVSGPITMAIDEGLRLGLPAVLALECSPFAGLSSTVAHGLGQAIGQWIMAWLACGGVAARVLKLQPRDWRLDMWGESPSSEDARKRERIEAEVIKFAALGCGDGAGVGDDEAPGIKIGQWGMYAQAVDDALAKKYRHPVGAERQPHRGAALDAVRAAALQRGAV